MPKHGHMVWFSNERSGKESMITVAMWVTAAALKSRYVATLIVTS